LIALLKKTTAATRVPCQGRGDEYLKRTGLIVLLGSNGPALIIYWVH